MELSRKQRQRLTPTQRDYLKLATRLEPKRAIWRNMGWAFLIGGGICLLGQIIQYMFIHFAGFDPKTVGNPTVAVLILLSVILTSLGMYDRIAQLAGAGSAVPVTGFANAMCSAALEHRTEGFVLGVGGQLFKIAGPVIVFGTVAAFLAAIIRVSLKSLIG